MVAGKLFLFLAQIQVPPSLDELASTPVGTIIIKEDSSITLKCFAEGIPEPIVKWYRWKQYKNSNTGKEGQFLKTVETSSRTLKLHFSVFQELAEFGNELFIQSVKRNDAFVYECVAKNSVPPATSRQFNIEVQCRWLLEIFIVRRFSNFFLLIC
jgi:hypothetical protein